MKIVFVSKYASKVNIPINPKNCILKQLRISRPDSTLFFIYKMNYIFFIIILNWFHKINIFTNIFFFLFFIIICKRIIHSKIVNFILITDFKLKKYSILYIFLTSNLIASIKRNIVLFPLKIKNVASILINRYLRFLLFWILFHQKI